MSLFTTCQMEKWSQKPNSGSKSRAELGFVGKCTNYINKLESERPLLALTLTVKICGYTVWMNPVHKLKSQRFLLWPVSNIQHCNPNSFLAIRTPYFTSSNLDSSSFGWNTGKSMEFYMIQFHKFEASSSMKLQIYLLYYPTSPCPAKLFCLLQVNNKLIGIYCFLCVCIRVCMATSWGLIWLLDCVHVYVCIRKLAKVTES